MTIPLAVLDIRLYSLILLWLKGALNNLSPTFFLVVIDPLLRDMSQKSLGLSVHGLYVGSVGHADDIHTTAAYKPIPSCELGQMFPEDLPAFCTAVQC